MEESIMVEQLRLMNQKLEAFIRRQIEYYKKQEAQYESQYEAQCKAQDNRCEETMEKLRSVRALSHRMSESLNLPAQADSTDDDTDEDEDLTVFNDSAGEAYSQDDNAVVEYDPVPADARSTSKLGNNNTSTPMNFTTKLEFPTVEVSTTIAHELFDKSPEKGKLEMVIESESTDKIGEKNDKSVYEVVGEVYEVHSAAETEVFVGCKIETKSNIGTDIKLIGEFDIGLEVALEGKVNIEFIKFDSSHDWGGAVVPISSHEWQLINKQNPNCLLNGCAVEALDLFYKMNQMDLKLDKNSLASVISACVNISPLELGEQGHKVAVWSCCLDSNVPLADLYVNDAFDIAHRAHASTQSVTKFLKPFVTGFLMQKKIDYLVGTASNSKMPFAAIVGGSKVSSKIGVIESFLAKFDIIILGGGMIFTFYKAQGLSVGSSLVEEDKFDLATSLLEKAKSKGVSLVLPSDDVMADKLLLMLTTRLFLHLVFLMAGWVCRSLIAPPYASIDRLKQVDGQVPSHKKLIFRQVAFIGATMFIDAPIAAKLAGHWWMIREMKVLIFDPGGSLHFLKKKAARVNTWEDAEIFADYFSEFG